MKTFLSSFKEISRKTAFILLFFAWAMASCTSGKDNPVQRADPARVYKPTPTVRDMNQQSSDVNRKKNIEEASPNAPANQPPEVRSRRLLRSRPQPTPPAPIIVKPDTVRRDTIR
ncbi:hypothetical protein TH61_02995 [Rufibacter sp. DG15C]|uniref:hypothetical protein n=1 Tax=Rufibacter sp. DG15C TaxID=1379909 RepID=UPI00078B1C96|nr:hypothetical protein [Rufibacter sp. DG15C]AMM50352.1 hypothetical protein TH61_02995 [Rufibacter sp. DG15C]